MDTIYRRRKTTTYTIALDMCLLMKQQEQNACFYKLNIELHVKAYRAGDKYSFEPWRHLIVLYSYRICCLLSHPKTFNRCFIRTRLTSIDYCGRRKHITTSLYCSTAPVHCTTHHHRHRAACTERSLIVLTGLSGSLQDIIYVVCPSVFHSEP